MIFYIVAYCQFSLAHKGGSGPLPLIPEAFVNASNEIRLTDRQSFDDAISLFASP